MEILSKFRIPSWTPVISNVTEEGEQYLKITDWYGGVGVKPASNLYITETGYSSNRADAVPVGGDGSGSQGPQGNQGNQGSQGSQGAQGAQGNQGVQGFQGNQGTTGSGTQGFQGFQGSQGNQGFQGNQGNQGLTGSGTQGNQGPQGSQGSQGLQGVQGIQGVPGIPASSQLNVITTSDSLLTYEDEHIGIHTLVRTTGGGNKTHTIPAQATLPILTEGDVINLATISSDVTIEVEPGINFICDSPAPWIIAANTTATLIRLGTDEWTAAAKFK